MGLPADASDATETEPMQGWMSRVIGKGKKEAAAQPLPLGANPPMNFKQINDARGRADAN